MESSKYVHQVKSVDTFLKSMSENNKEETWTHLKIIKISNALKSELEIWENNNLLYGQCQNSFKRNKKTCSKPDGFYFEYKFKTNMYFLVGHHLSTFFVLQSFQPKP